MEQDQSFFVVTLVWRPTHSIDAFFHRYMIFHRHISLLVSIKVNDPLITCYNRIIISMCIIRQILNKHSIIDSYPKVLIEFNKDEIAQQKFFAKSSANQDDDKNGLPPAEMCDLTDTSATSSSSSFLISGITMNSGKAKISQDVLIFQKLTESLPPRSLLHLLQGASQASELDSGSTALESGPEWIGQEGRRVRFVTTKSGEVQAMVYEIPRICDPTLWWQSQDFGRIRENAAAIAQHYRQASSSTSDYTKVFSRVVKLCAMTHHRPGHDRILDSFFECLATHDAARGLEGHIMYECHQMSAQHVRMVLAAQEQALFHAVEYLEDDDDDNDHDGNDDLDSDIDSEYKGSSSPTRRRKPLSASYLRREAAIRRACLYHSRVSQRLAVRLAQHDTAQALKSIFTVWHSPSSLSSRQPPLKPTRSQEEVVVVCD